MNKIILIGMTCLFAALTGCESETPLLPEAEQLVVRAYLYAGEPVTDIRLTATYAITSEDTIGLPIKDVAVTLEKNGRNYRLTSSPGDSGYYHYGGSELEVNIGDKFRIAVDYQGRIASGETTIPSAPRGLEISADEFFISTGRIDTSSITVSWAEEEDTFFFVTVENLESVLTPINERLGNFLTQLRSFRSRPIRGNTYRISRFDLNYLGRHRARVYKVNREYANLYAFGQQDSRNLNEPETNIENGLGVFAGFSSDAVEFTVRTN